MKSRIRKAVKIFKRKREAAFYSYAGQVTLAMSKAIGTFPTPVPALKDINTELKNFSQLMKSAGNGDRVQIALKGKSRSILNGMMSQLTDYVNMQAMGSETALAQSCMDISKMYELIKTLAPSVLVLTDGPNSGTLKLKCKKVKGAKSYIFQYSNDPEMKGATMVSIAASTASYIFTGLIKSNTYYCRVAAVGGNKQVVYSNIVNRVCN